MNVRELIAKLQEFDPDAEIGVTLGDEYTESVERLEFEVVKPVGDVHADVKAWSEKTLRISQLPVDWWR